MNTVGKPDRLGESIRCVVSVSMLTEGWDANTVTHVLGVRAFGTQLLCEQVIGRALRRQSYEINEDGPNQGMFNVEYADVLGIPFDFNAKPVVAPPQPPRETIQVKAMRPERDHLEITFPRVQGYWALLFDFHRSVLSLIPKPLCGGAFALVRPCMEAIARAHVAVKGTAADIKSLQDDTYRTDFSTIGPWIDSTFGAGDLFKNLFDRARNALHSYTHAGISQLGRRYDDHNLKPSYRDGEIIEVIRVCTSAVWMVTILVTKHLGWGAEATKTGELFEEWGKHDSK